MGLPAKSRLNGGPSVFGKLILIVSIILLLYILDMEGFCQSADRDIFSFRQVDFMEGVWQRIFADFDGDGFEEFVSTNGKGALVSDFDEQVAKSACHLRGSDSVTMLAARDFIGSRAPELILGLKKKNKLWTEIYCIEPMFGEVQCSLLLVTDPIYGEDRNGDEGWDGKIEDCQTADLNQDGIKDILVAASSGYDLNPRSIIAYNGQDGTRLWEFRLAGPPYPIICRDIDWDGLTEIIVGTWAPFNGREINDMSDSLCYLICLDHEGGLIWKDVMGGAFESTKYILGDLGNNGTFEIICTYSSGKVRDKSTHYELQIRSAASGAMIKYYPLQTGFKQPYLADLNRNGFNEIVITNQDGNVYVFNDSLEIIQQAGFEYAPAKNEIAGICDVDQDGSLDVMLCSGDSLIILNNHLKRLAGCSAGMAIDPKKVHFLYHPSYKGLFSLIMGQKNGYKKASILKLGPPSRTPFVEDVFSGYSMVLLLLMFLAGVLVTILLIRVIPALVRRLKGTALRLAEDRRYDVLETISSFGHGKTATGNLDRLSLLFKNIPKDQPLSPEHRSKIDESVQSYFEFTSPRLNEIIRRSRTAEVGLGQVEELESCLAKLETVFQSYERLGPQINSGPQLARVVPTLIETLEERIESLERELAIFFSCPISSTVYDVLKALAPDLRGAKISLGSLSFSGDVGAKAFIARNDFMEVFEELIRNSIYAMRESVRKRLNVGISVGEHKIFIEVSDTGCGIAWENIERVFGREFSTKNDGGFGLYHAKTTLDKYGGKINIAASEPRNGTMFRIELKKIG
jgi:signal transduction histidine kinase